MVLLGCYRFNIIFLSHLGLGHDDVDAVRPGLDQVETLDSEVEPLVGVGLEVGPEGQPLLALPRLQEASDIAS